jgi:hypothetical protein
MLLIEKDVKKKLEWQKCVILKVEKVRERERDDYE